MYGIIIIMLFLVPWRLQIEGRFNKKINCWLEFVFAVCELLAGIIAGWTNENNSVALICMLLIYNTLTYKRKLRLHIWNYSGCVGSIIGCLLMLTSPGTAKRLNGAGGGGDIIAYIKRFVFISCDMMTYLHLAFILLLIFGGIILVLHLNQKQQNLERIVKYTVFENSIPIIYFMGFIVSVYSMIASPQFPERVWSGPVILLAIVIINLMDSAEAFLERWKTIKLCIGVFLCLLTICVYVNALMDVKNVNACYEQREKIIQDAFSKGENVVLLPQIKGYTGYSCYSYLGDINKDSSLWPNTAIAKYYGLKKIELN